MTPPPEALLEPPTASGAVSVEQEGVTDSRDEGIVSAYFLLHPNPVGVFVQEHDVLVEKPIDYEAAAAVLRNARAVEEVESPLGGTPFGA